MIRALIVDDEPLARRGIRVCLRNAVDISVVGECSTGKEAVKQIRRLKPDLLFLDVQMPDMNGLEVVRQIAGEVSPLVVFLTAYDEFALEAFSVHATDYLLKPIDDERFKSALKVVRARFAERAGSQPAPYVRNLPIKSAGRTLLIDTEKIVWFRSNGDYVTVHLEDRSHLVRDSIDRLEQSLDPARFRRVHRSAIVALDRIREYRVLSSRDIMLCLSNGAEVRASRRFRHNLPTSSLSRSSSAP